MTDQEKCIVCFGPGPRSKGGIAQYNTSLARAYTDAGVPVQQVAWKRQYPFFIPRDFKDRTSKSDLTEGYNIPVEYITDWNNPISWRTTVKKIISMRPRAVHIHWYNPTQSLPLAFITKRLRQLGIKKVIYDLHLVETKEKSKLDRWLTKRALKYATDIIVHGSSVKQELMDLMEKEIHSKGIRVLELYHPVYSAFKPDEKLDVQKLKRELGLREHVFLFFGFIREYKGLHNCIRGFKVLSEKRDDVSLLICGESFWDTVDRNKLSTKIKRAIFGFVKRILLQSSGQVDDYRPLDLLSTIKDKGAYVVKNDFIPNEEVHRYFQVSDGALLLYENATPSGVESLAYNFGTPVLATNVGNFSNSVIDGVNGYLCPSTDPADIAYSMEQLINRPIARESVLAQTERMSWKRYVRSVLDGA